MRDFFKEEWVEDPSVTTLTEDLVEVLVHLGGDELLVAVEEVEKLRLASVGEGEDRRTPGQISKRNVLKQLVMVM